MSISDSFDFEGQIFRHLPVEFFTKLANGMPRVYRSAADQAFKEFEPQPGKDLLPHIRRARVDEFLKGLAESYTFLSPAYRPNAGKNCSHIEIGAGPIVLTGSKVNNPNQIVREAVFRSTLAESNRLFLPGIFRNNKTNGKLYCIILHGPTYEDAGELSFLHLAVPDRSCRTYIGNINLLAMTSKQNNITPEVVVDKAIPKLKMLTKDQSV